MIGNMSDSRKVALHDDITTFGNYMEVLADASIQELTTDVDRVQPTSPAVAASCPADNRRVDDGVGRYRAIWRHIHRLLSSSVGLVLLLLIYTVAGAAVLHHTEYDRELQMHAELDALRRRVVADIVNLTASRSRDGRAKSRDLGDVTLTDAVEALVVEYSDAGQSLSKSPGWTFTGAMYFCGTVYTTVGQFYMASLLCMVYGQFLHMCLEIARVVLQLVGLWMQNYKSLCAAVTIRATLVNIQTHRQTDNILTSL